MSVYSEAVACLFEAEGKLLAAASAAANARDALGENGSAAYDLVRGIDAALIEARYLQAQFAGDDDATGL